MLVRKSRVGIHTRRGQWLVDWEIQTVFRIANAMFRKHLVNQLVDVRPWIQTVTALLLARRIQQEVHNYEFCRLW